jgi:hypothetical protein
MTEGVQRSESHLAWLALLLLAVGTGLRLATSIVSGFVEWHDSDASIVPPGRARAFDVLTTFGASGDGTGVLLMAAAAAAAWWVYRLRDPRAVAGQLTVAWLSGVTAVLAAMQGVGVALAFSLAPGRQTSRFIQVEGYAVAYLVLAVGVLLVTRRLALLADERALADEDLDAFVFAVDRKSGDVRAFLSASDAVRRMHVYSVEDSEFIFYTDEGVVLDASVVDDRIVLRPTEEVHQDALLVQLKEFANRRGITVDDDDADDPTAYAIPISRWHWLEMWPPWMRPIGMLFRRTG